MFRRWLEGLRIRFAAYAADREIISEEENDLPRHLKAVGKWLDAWTGNRQTPQ